MEPGENIISEKKSEQAVRKRSRWWEVFDIGRFIHHRSAVRQLPFVFFLTSLVFIYITNSLWAERLIRGIHTADKQIKEARWKYMNAKSDLENRSRRSEVANAVLPMGLKVPQNPPQKIESGK